jgi:hypothetical protein
MTVHNTHVRTAIAPQRARTSGHSSFESEILELNPFFPGLA